MTVLTVICDGGWMSENLSEGWGRVGFDVEEFFYGSHMGKSWDRAGRWTNREVNKHLLETAARLHSEGRLALIFCVIYDDVLDVETIKALRGYGIPIVNYHVDLVGQWYRILRTGKYFDRVACAHRNHWAGLRKAGVALYYMPMAANPPPQAVSDEEFDGVLYLGSPWSYRREVLAELARQGFNLRIYGNNWTRATRDESKNQYWRKNVHDLFHYAWPRVREEGVGSLFQTVAGRFRGQEARKENADVPPGIVRGRYAGRDFEKLVRGAAINLGFTHFKGRSGTLGEKRQVRLREFEIPMAGGFYLAQDCSQLRELYEPGRHLDVWDKVPDLSEKIRHHLSHPEERRQIAAAGREHALSHHTWEKRFQGLMQELKMSVPVQAAEK